MKIFKIFCLILLLLFPSLCFATDYYVDADATGDNNGTTKEHAWESFAEINWSTVDSGNGKLFVCGTHTETMTVTVSGEDGYPINIITCTTANGASADDPGIIDGSATRTEGIIINSVSTEKSWITIDGLTVQNHTHGGSYDHAIAIYANAGGGKYSDHITIKNVTVTSDDGMGITCISCTNLILENSSIDVGNDPDAGGAVTTDGVVIGGGGSGNTVDGCLIHQRQNGGTAHNDAIQMTNETNFTIKNSHIHSVGDDINGQTLFLQRLKGTLYVNNNIILTESNNTNNGFCLDNGSPNDWNAVTYVYNNTVWDTSGYHNAGIFGYLLPTAINLTIKNNILIADEFGIDFNGGTPTDKSKIDNNLYYTQGGYVGQDAAGAKNWADWKTAGYDANGVNSEPLLTSIPTEDFTLTSLSPAIGAGADIAGILGGLDPTSTWPDNVKPVNQDDYGAWEIGAFVYIEAAELGGPGTIPGGGLGSIPGGGLGSIVGTEP